MGSLPCLEPSHLLTFGRAACWVPPPVQLLAAHVMNPAHIEVEVADVLGLDTIIEELEYKVGEHRGRGCLESSARTAFPGSQGQLPFVP